MSSMNASDLWTRACTSLQDQLQPDIYSRWIEVIQAIGYDGHRLTLGVNNDFYQSWLEENYLPLIRDAVRAAAGHEVPIDFSITHRELMVEPADKKPRAILREKLTKAFRQEPSLHVRYTFEEFIVGPSNNFAHAAAQAVAQAPARAYNPLFIYGGNGLGKTHLMQAIGHHVLATSHASVCYISCEQFLNEYITALQDRSLVQFRKKYRSADVLLIDDIHFLANKDALQEEFFHTFNALFDARRQIVLTSDRSASEIRGLEKRLVTRFEWGLVTELDAPDLETRIAVLRHKQGQSDVRIPDELIMFIAENVISNMRSLEGALVRAVSYRSLTGQELTVDALKYLLRDIIEKERQTKLSFDDVQKAVAEHFDVRVADMTSKHRPRAVAMPRQVAMYLCRRLMRSSLPEIAGAFHKTHATVLHAYKTIDGRMDVDGELRKSVSTICQRLGQPSA